MKEFHRSLHPNLAPARSSCMSSAWSDIQIIIYSRGDQEKLSEELFFLLREKARRVYSLYGVTRLEGSNFLWKMD